MTQGNHTPRKLTDDQVREIRALRAQGGTYRAIGARFGVSAPMIHKIATGKSRVRKTLADAMRKVPCLIQCNPGPEFSRTVTPLRFIAVSAPHDGGR